MKSKNIWVNGYISGIRIFKIFRVQRTICHEQAQMHAHQFSAKSLAVPAQNVKVCGNE